MKVENKSLKNNKKEETLLPPFTLYLTLNPNERSRKITQDGAHHAGHVNPMRLSTTCNIWLSNVIGSHRSEIWTDTAYNWSHFQAESF